MTGEEITSSNHLCILETYYEALTFIFKAYKFFSRQTEYPVNFDKSTLNVGYKRFIVEYMANCSTVDHTHKEIKEFKIYRNKNATPKQKAFALYILGTLISWGLLDREKIFLSLIFQ